jgi:hypothetical protein
LNLSSLQELGCPLFLRSKSDPTFTRKTGIWEFGIDKEDYDRYLMIPEESLVVFGWEGGNRVYVWALRRDVENVRFFEGYGNGGCYFIPKDDCVEISL